MRRGSEILTVDITATERVHDFDGLADFADSDTSVIPRFGILGVDITKQNAQIVPTLRLPFGVLVVGYTREEADGADTGLTAGDTIFVGAAQRRRAAIRIADRGTASN